MKPRNDAEDGLVRDLGHLAELDDREVSAYEAAIKRVHGGDRAGLARLMADHRRHAAYLRLLIVTLGGGVPHGHLHLLTTKGRLLLASLGGEEGILELMRGEEDRVTRAYLAAMSRPLPARAHRVMEKALREQLHHGAWIEQAIARERAPQSHATSHRARRFGMTRDG